MLVFETVLKKIKYDILREVVILAKENRVTQEELEKIPSRIIQGEKPSYRCCVHKERAIVYERAKLAAGYLADGNIFSELTDIKKEEQILYVIESACDRCPINKYTVTEACRGCIQHKCMEVCPVNAITKIGGRSYINQEICKECGMCKKVCPYDAISEVMRPCKRVCPTDALSINTENRKAVINDEDCINCGACMNSCPFGAISDKSYIVPVTKALVKKKNVYAVVAPAIAGQFGNNVSVGQIKDAFNKVGFKAMFEAACGADAVTVHEGLEFAERIESGKKYMTNSCCPGFLSYIEKKFPTEVSNISSTVSPMIATGRLIKSMDQDAVVVFVGPCTAKKAEIKRDRIDDAVDHVLTFEEIAALMAGFDVDPEQCENIEIQDASLFGRNFARAGGLTESVENFINEKELNIEFKAVKASGIEEIKRAMTMAKLEKLQGNFIEGMMCEGGCIAGPGTFTPQNKTKIQLSKYSKESVKLSVLSNEKIEEFKDINLER